MMYTLDLRSVQPPVIRPLGDKFSGSSPDGREVAFTNFAMMYRAAGDAQLQPFFGVSGEMHYCRVSPDQWEDAILKMKCGGVNIISAYAFWITHEEEEGVFRFDGCRDLRRFLALCRRHDMLVIMRIGPFCHGEFRNGGLPDWLYGQPFDVRDPNPGFLAAVRRYFQALHQQMDGFYFHQGGCIVGTQIDNEYEHSSAPWEITTGISTEWVHGGGAGESYMLALKQIMQEEGIVTPFYTATAWGGAVTPVEEALPLWGGYSYQPWLFYSPTNRPEKHPATPEYIYRDNHNNAVPSCYNFAPAYPPEDRPYACCEMMGGMMCSYNYRFQMDMRAIDALANTKLGSGCNLLGYYMYKGGTNPTGVRTPYLNESQVSKRSYDYQAALGEYGQVRESYGRLRALHLLCQTFAPLLARAGATLPEHMHTLQPEDAAPLRFTVRSCNGSGFLFVNNFQDHLDLPPRTDECVTLQLPGGDVTFRFSLASGENAVLPFGLQLGSARLDWATAQPITQTGDAWFFLAPDGMTPRYCLNGHVYDAAADSVITAEGVTIVTMSRRESLGFGVFGHQPCRSDKPLIWDGERLRVETEDGTAAVHRFVGGAWQTLHVGQRHETVSVPFRRTGRGRYVLDIPLNALQGCKQALLRIHYVGDIGHAFLKGSMISDNFANGAAWDVRVDDLHQQLTQSPLTICITPIKKDVTVDVSSAMAGRMERASGLQAELLEVSLIQVEELEIPQA